MAVQAAIKTKGAPTVVEIIADGLDAVADGRGFGGEHLEAVKLANASPKLLSALRCAVLQDPSNWREIARAALAEAEKGAR
jgi:hypothetical protein